MATSTRLSLSEYMKTADQRSLLCGPTHELVVLDEHLRLLSRYAARFAGYCRRDRQGSFRATSSNGDAAIPHAFGHYATPPDHQAFVVKRPNVLSPTSERRLSFSCHGKANPGQTEMTLMGLIRDRANPGQTEMTLMKSYLLPKPTEALPLGPVPSVLIFPIFPDIPCPDLPCDESEG